MRSQPSAASTAFLLALLILMSSACKSGTDVPQDGPQNGDPPPAEPVELTEGAVLGTETFPPGNTAEGGQGEPLGDIGCIESVPLHYHAHVSLFVEGERIAIPLAVGVVDPVINDDGLVVGGDCIYWMHSHDASGLIHIEPPAADDFTLGQLFDIWGRNLSSDNVAGFAGELSVFLDGERYDGDPAGIVLDSRTHVSLQVGQPLVSPPMYLFEE